jgi:hypothetical protein
MHRMESRSMNPCLTSDCLLCLLALLACCSACLDLAWICVVLVRKTHGTIQRMTTVRDSGSTRIGLGMLYSNGHILMVIFLWSYSALETAARYRAGYTAGYRIIVDTWATELFFIGRSRSRRLFFKDIHIVDTQRTTVRSGLIRYWFT